MADLHDTSNEEWRQVVGFESFYSVSSNGRVRRDRQGRGPCVVGRIMKTRLNDSGYPVLVLSAPKNTRTARIHQLVAEAFIGTKPLGLVVNHKNGIKTDNTPSNLEYVTVIENNQHATRNKLRPLGDRNGSRTHPEAYPRGENHHMVSIDDKQLISVRKMNDAGIRPRDIVRAFPMSKSTFYRIIRGQDRFSVT